MLKRFFVGMALALVVSSAAMADPAVVTRVDPGSVGVNFGSQQRAQYGQEFYVYRNGLLVGRIRLSQVQDNVSMAQVVQTEPNTSVQVGDVISAYAPRPGTPTAAVASGPAQNSYAPVSSDPVNLGDAEGGFHHMVKDRTRTYMFDATSRAKTPIMVPVTSLYMLTVANPARFGLFGTGVGGAVNPWLVGSTAYSVYETAEMRKRLANMPGAGGTTSRAYIETIYWDQALLDSYTNYYLQKQATPVTAAQREQTRMSMLSQKGLDKNLVFQVQVTNRGTTALTMSPFNWHFYLLDSHGNRVKAARYDQALDGAVAPNASINGYVYFDRFDANGGPTVGNGPVKVYMDEVLGKHTTVTW